MGQFSWTDCADRRKKIRIGQKAFVLVPPAHRKRYGEKIATSGYDGYGHFGGFDIYELAALWNRESLSEELLVPVCTDPMGYGGLYGFEVDELKAQGLTDSEIQARDMAQRVEWRDAAVRRHEARTERLKDFVFRKLSDEEMEAKYGEDYLREIGIDVSCYDWQNERLECPIKITNSPTAAYEECGPSKGDPGQGR